jgi:hypothetical protein
VAKGKLDLYALGQKGVNLTNNPLAVEDSELLQGQNAIISYEQGRGGIRKRGGLAGFNATPLNSGASILAIKNVPLPLPVATSGQSPRQLWYPTLGDSWKVSNDGTTFTDSTVPGFVDEGAPARGNEALPPPLPGSFLYFHTPGTETRDIWNYDGTSADFVAAVIPPPGISADTADRLQGGVWHNGSLYIGYYRDLATSPGGRVLKVNPTTGQLTMVGNGFPNGAFFLSPYDFVSWNGLIFVAARCNAGTGGLADAKVFRMDPDTESDWTVDATFTDLQSLGVESIAKFQQYLYVTVVANGATGSYTVRRRDAGGTWTTVRTTAAPLTTNGVPIIYAFGDVLILYEDGKLYRSTNGTAYTQELDIFATYGDDEPIGKPIIFNGSLYVPSYAGLFQRTAGVGGTWTRVVTTGSNSRTVTVLNVR